MKKKHRLKRLPMRYQMTLGFTIPIFCIMLIFLYFVYPRLKQSYRESTARIYEQNCQQAELLLETHFETMANLAALVANNEEINDVLGREDFLSQHSSGENYEDFNRLRSALNDITNSFPAYQLSIYLPDTVPYSINRYNIYPESELEAQSDYRVIMGKIEGGIPFVTSHLEEDNNGASLKYNSASLYQIIPAGKSREEGYVVRVDMLYTTLADLMKSDLASDENVILLMDEQNRVICDSTAAGFPSFEQETDEEEELALLETSDSRYVSFESEAIQYSEWHILYTVPYAVFEQKNTSFRIAFFAAFFAIAVCIYGISFALSGHYTGRLTSLSSQMKELEKGNLEVALPEEDGGPSDEIDQIIHSFNFMTDELRKLMQDHYKMGKSVKSAELKALQAQINPHFLYNTLDLINWTAMEYGETEIADIAQNLAKFYRLSLNHGRNTLTIREEIEHVEVYVNIQNFHFSNRIQMEVAMEDGLGEYGTPNIILQPLIENSILHGIGERPDIESCRLKVSVIKSGNDILFTVEDNGPGIPEEKMENLVNTQLTDGRSGYGIKNINFRLKLYFGEKYGLHYENIEPHGVKAQVLIPAMSVDEIEQMII